MTIPGFGVEENGRDPGIRDPGFEIRGSRSGVRDPGFEITGLESLVQTCRVDVANS